MKTIFSNNMKSITSFSEGMSNPPWFLVPLELKMFAWSGEDTG